MARDLREAVALALINQAENNTLDPHPYESLDDVSGPRVRSEIPYADAAIAAVLDWLIVNAEETDWSIYGHRITTQNGYEQLQFFDISASDWIRSFREAGQ